MNEVGKLPSSSKDEVLDPRIQCELEQLNQSSLEINSLELLLDDARRSFRQVLSDSTQQLDILLNKQRSFIEKARPYYEARIKAKEAQIDTQNAAIRFERACSQQAAAREMVNLAEIGFFKKGQPFDPAWQEMLNHATVKVNEAEEERAVSEAEHQQVSMIYNELENLVKTLQRKLRRSINKSKSYFETKAKFNQYLEEQKKHIGHIEAALNESKRQYSDALKSLEDISDTIHQQRRDSDIRAEMGPRVSGVGAETPDKPPANDSFSIKDDSQKTGCLGRSVSLQAIPRSSQATIPRPTSIVGLSKLGEELETTEIHPKDIDNAKTPCIPHSELVNPDDWSPEEGNNSCSLKDTQQTNAELMASLQAAKGVENEEHVEPCREELEDIAGASSECESVSGGVASANVSVIGDDQIGKLMLDTDNLVDYVTDHLDVTGEHTPDTSSRSLPKRLSYLEEHIHFKPEWVEDDLSDIAKTPTNDSPVVIHKPKSYTSHFDMQI